MFRFKIDILDIGRELLTMYGKSLYSFIKVNLSILDTKKRDVLRGDDPPLTSVGYFGVAEIKQTLQKHTEYS